MAIPVCVSAITLSHYPDINNSGALVDSTRGKNGTSATQIIADDSIIMPYDRLICNAMKQAGCYSLFYRDGDIPKYVYKSAIHDNYGDQIFCDITTYSNFVILSEPITGVCKTDMLTFVNSSPATQPKTLFAYGHSTAQGFYCDDDPYSVPPFTNGYIDRLAHAKGLILQNNSIQSTALQAGGGLSNSLEVLADTLPVITANDYVIIDHQINDMVFTIGTINTFKTVYGVIIDKFVVAGADTSKIWLNEGSFADSTLCNMVTYGNYRQAVKDVATTKGVNSFDTFNYMELWGGMSLLYSGFHPGRNGHYIEFKAANSQIY